MLPEDMAAATCVNVDQVNRALRDISQKRKATGYLRLAPGLAGDVPEISLVVKS